MLFTSYAFIAFLTVLFLLCYLSPAAWRPDLLFVFSLLFYAFAGIPSFFLALVVCIVTFLCGKSMRRTPGKTAGRAPAYAAVTVCVVSVLACLLSLCWRMPASLAGVRVSFFHPFAAPLGITYLALRAVSYIVDVYRGTIPPETAFKRLALYLTFFPLVPTGPVTRYPEMQGTLFTAHPFEAEAFLRGLSRLVFGFFKKLVIADRLAIAVTALCGAPDTYHGGYVAVLMVFYTTQLYADFTGGIDISLGACEMLGVRAPENFRNPYGAKTLAEFWNRWHITLGTWFRDYVFYPLSTSAFMVRLTRRLAPDDIRSHGHRRTWLRLRLPVYVPTLFVWLLTGLWHGIALHFAVWGLLNGILLLISRELSRGRAPLLPESLRIARTLFLVSALRLLDCYRSVPVAFRMFFSLFSSHGWAEIAQGGLLSLGLSPADYAVCILAVVVVRVVSANGGFTQDALPDGDLRTRLAASPFPLRAALFSAMLLLTLVCGIYGHGYDAAGFIYARF